MFKIWLVQMLAAAAVIFSTSMMASNSPNMFWWSLIPMMIFWILMDIQQDLIKKKVSEGLKKDA